MPFEQKEYAREHYRKNKEKYREQQRQYYRENKEKVNAANKAWKEKNKEKIKEYKRKYVEKDPERRLEQQRAYREKNTEKIRLRRKEYRIKNKEVIKEKSKAYGKANKDKRNVNSAKRRALKFRATIRLTELDKFVIDEMYSLAVLRTEQTGIRWHVDHIVPLTKGGLHKPTNLQVVPGSWNESKGNRNCEVYNRIVQNGY